MREWELQERSERGKVQDAVIGWLKTWCDVLPTPLLQPVPRGGFVRPVTFTSPFAFTATLIIWSVDRLTLRVTGMETEITFDGVQEFKEFCQRHFDAPRSVVVQEGAEVTALRAQVAILREQLQRLSAENTRLRGVLTTAYKSL